MESISKERENDSCSETNQELHNVRSAKDAEKLERGKHSVKIERELTRDGKDHFVGLASEMVFLCHSQKKKLQKHRTRRDPRIFLLLHPRI